MNIYPILIHVDTLGGIRVYQLTAGGLKALWREEITGAEILAAKRNGL